MTQPLKPYLTPPLACAALLAAASAAAFNPQPEPPALVVDEASAYARQQIFELLKVPALRLEFSSALSEIDTPRPDDVLLAWQDAAGIDPEPFRIFVPGSCFVGASGRFHVTDAHGCGVRVSWHGADGRSDTLEALEFEARLSFGAEGSARLAVEATLRADGRGSELLGAIGGAPVAVAIGVQRGQAAVLEVETVMGIEPQPF